MQTNFTYKNLLEKKMEEIQVHEIINMEEISNN
jgi:hypothetical protein